MLNETLTNALFFILDSLLAHKLSYSVVNYAALSEFTSIELVIYGLFTN